TNECVIKRSVESTEVIVIEIELQLAQFVTILCKFANKRELLLPLEIYARVGATLSDLLASDRAEIGNRFVIVNRTDVIAPPIGEVGATLDQEEQMMCSAIQERLWPQRGT